MAKDNEVFRSCRTPRQVVEYLLTHGGDKSRLRYNGSHLLVPGPRRSVGIQYNHPNDQLQKGILSRLEREMIEAGFRLE